MLFQYSLRGISVLHIFVFMNEHDYPDELQDALERIGAERFGKLWESIYPELDREFGRMIIFGTGGPIGPLDPDEFLKMFYDPTGYNIIPWTEKDL